MNKIYFAIVHDDYGGVYVSAPNLKEAKKVAMTDELISEYLDNYIDLKCHAKRDKDKKIKRTELPTKVLSIEEIITEKCHWWCCDNCEQDDNFEYSDTGEWGRYHCPKCGMMFNIPYVNS